MDIQKILAQTNKKPKTILKTVIGMAAVLMVMWLFMVSKMDVGSQNTTSQNAAQNDTKTENLRNSLLEKAIDKAEIQPVDEAEISDQPNTKAPTQRSEEVQEAESPDIFQNALVTFGLMICILGIIWVWARSKDQDDTKLPESSREIGSHSLSLGAQLKFIEINQEVWVVGVTETSVDLLHRVDRSEWTEEEFPVPSSPKESKTVKNGSRGDFKSLYKFFTN